MFCFEKIYIFSLGEEDFKQRFWAQPPFLSHILLGAVQAFSVLLEGWKTSILSRVFISVSWCGGFLVGGSGREFRVRFKVVWQ